MSPKSLENGGNDKVVWLKETLTGFIFTKALFGLIFICFTTTDGIYKIALNTATAVPAQSLKAPVFNSEDFARIQCDLAFAAKRI